jgi:hypothetical protein
VGRCKFLNLRDIFMSQPSEHALIKFLLPEGILDYFEVMKVDPFNGVINIHLQELNVPPTEYKDHKLASKGFFDEIKVQDFPIRGKAAYLFIKRRRWLDKSTQSTVYRNWELLAKGTRMTNDFAAFLKVINRYQGG